MDSFYLNSAGRNLSCGNDNRFSLDHGSIAVAFIIRRAPNDKIRFFLNFWTASREMAMGSSTLLGEASSSFSMIIRASKNISSFVKVDTSLLRCTNKRMNTWR